MKGQWLAHFQGQGLGQHQGKSMVAHVRATKTGVGIGLCGFGEPAAAKAVIMLAGREAKEFMAALEQAMREAGLAQGD